MTELESRLETLERAVTDGENDLSELASEADALERLNEVEATCEQFERQLAELEAATQAVRGYVGSIRAVNSEVEQRADAALAAVESLEEQLEATERNGEPSSYERTDTQKSSLHQQQSPETQRPTNRPENKRACCACGRPQQSRNNRENTGVAVSDGGEWSGYDGLVQDGQISGFESEDGGTSDKEPGTLTRIRKLL